jgi:hypothetical protein
MVLNKNDLPGHWATPPPTQAIATGSNVLIAQVLGVMRRAQEEVVADTKKTPPPPRGGGWSRSPNFCV